MVILQRLEFLLRGGRPIISMGRRWGRERKTELMVRLTLLRLTTRAEEVKWTFSIRLVKGETSFRMWSWEEEEEEEEEEELMGVVMMKKKY
jgi:hypothetical protein